MTDLTGKTALVTGGSRGIGAAIALALAAKGADVAISYERTAERANDIVARIEALGRRGVAIKANAADAEAVQALVDTTVADLGGLDIVVNNAGTFRHGDIADLSLDDIDTLLDVNIRGTVLTTKAAIPHLKGGARIITIGSNLAERVPFPGLTMYALTKSAHHAFTRGLARELGPRNITVNLVQPGPIDTELNPADGGSSQDNISLSPLARYGSTEELANVVAFLAGEASSYVNGSVLTADGGYNA